jgi:hypothetical protein
MKRMPFKRVALSILLLQAFPAWAATYYFSNCGTGAAVGVCLNGADGNNGTSTSTPKQTMSAFVTLANSAAPGDRFLFSKGGAWNNFTTLLETRNGTLAAFAANPVVIGSFDPTTFSSSARPRLNLTSGASGNPVDSAAAFRFTGGSGTTLFGGYDISGFLIDGGGNTEFNSGFLVYNVGSYVNFHDNVVQGTMTFTGCQANSNGTNPAPRNITIRNNTMTDSLGMGITAFSCSDLLIEGNTLTRAANRTTITAASKGFDHAMYVSADETNATTRRTKNVVIRNNTMIDTCFGSTDAPTASSCTVMVGHGRSDGWTIENNLVKNSTKASANGYGVAFSAANFVSGQPEYNYRLTLRGNRFINVGYIGIQVDGTNGGIVESNVVVQEFAGEYVGIRQTNSNWSDSVPNFKNVYRNNSLWFANSDGSNPLYGLQINGVGSGQHVVSNNLIVFAGASGGKQCFATDIANTGFTAWDNNLCFGFNTWANGSSLASWQSSRSQDAASLSSNPNLVATPSYANNGSMKVQSGSPAINAGNTTFKSRLAIDGYPAVGARDIGAFEFGSNP